MSQYQTMSPSIPRRTSSASASTNESLSRTRSRETLSRLDSISSHHTPTFPHIDSQLQQHAHRIDSIRSNNKSHRKGPGKSGLTQIAEAGTSDNRGSDGETRISPQELRQRASSPLLGQTYNRKKASHASSYADKKHLRPSESASTLRSFYDPLNSPPTVSEDTGSGSTGDLPLRDNTGLHSSHSESHLGKISVSTAERNGDKPSKPKHRPPMIDLSKLFPKPRDQAMPLLSPHRMTSSPSPVSIRSDASSIKRSRFERLYPMGNKFIKQPRAKDVPTMRPLYEPEGSEYFDEIEFQQAQNDRRQRQKPPQPPLENGYPAKKNVRRGNGTANWFDGPEGNVSDDDDLDYVDKRAERKEYISSSRQGHDRPNATTSRSKEAATLSSKSMSPNPSTQSSANGSMSRKTSHTHASPRPISPMATKLQTSLSRWEEANGSREPSPTSGKLSKKSSRFTLSKSNLNQSSVLCLSSSEDEDDDVKGSQKKRGIRDSIATFDGDSEICTAEAVSTSGRHSAAKIRYGPATHNKTSKYSEKSRQRVADHSRTPSTLSSSFGGRAPSGRSIPTISEPDSNHTIRLPSTTTIDYGLRSHQKRNNQQSPPPTNRRSRFMAVTRQEEYLLELMRRNKGILPSNYSGEQSDQDAKTRSINGSSNAGSPAQDVSFLKLSPGYPPFGKGSFAHGEHGEGESYGAYDGGDHETERSSASPRHSLVHSDTIPSPSTSVTTPRTPTLPLHRLSPRVSQPPPFPPPALPEPQRHSRTRTDSSTAIVFANDDDAGKDNDDEPEFPIWALGWNNEATEVAVMH